MSGVRLNKAFRQVPLWYWFDWISPAAWTEEHNAQHHYRLNEEADPDLVERNLAWLREAELLRSLKLAIVPVLAAV